MGKRVDALRRCNVPLFALLAVTTLSADNIDSRMVQQSDHEQYGGIVAQLTNAPQNAENLQKLGQNYFLLGDFRRAIEALEKAAKLDPANSTIQTWLGRALGRRAESAFPLQAPGFAQKARQAFVKAVELDPQSSEALNDLFTFYLQAPGIVGGGFEKASSLLSQLQKYDPVGYHLAESRIDQKNGNIDDAEKQMRSAIEQGPGNVDPLLALATFLATEGRYEESENLFAQARKIQPLSQRVLFEQAQSDIGTKRNLDRARELLKQYIASTALTPDDPPRWEALRILRKAEAH